MLSGYMFQWAQRPWLLLTIACAGLVAARVGLATFRKGRHGTPIDAHPTCRRCKFDLFGIPSTSNRCPECGADVRARRAIVIGNRRTRAWWMVSGLALLCAALGFTLTLGIAVGSRVDWQAAKPAWWLLRESRFKARATREAALETLCLRVPEAGVERYRGLVLNADETNALIERLLEVQADTSIPWYESWGRPLVHRINDGTLPAGQRDAFFRHALVPTLSARSAVRQGDCLPMRLAFSATRSGISDFTASFDREDWRLSIDGVRVETLPRFRYKSRAVSSLNRMSRADSFDVVLDAEHVPKLSCGVHAVEFRAIARIRRGYQTWRKDVALVPIAASATFTVYPHSDPVQIEWVEDPSLDDAMALAISGDAVLILRGDTAKANVSLCNGWRDDTIAKLPMPISYRVTLKQGSRVWPVGTLSTSLTDDYMGVACQASLDGIQHGDADVIFTPDALAATETVDVVRAWRGDVIVHGVPVNWRP